jgi:hypothetical protein
MRNDFRDLIKKKMLNVLLGLNEFETEKYRIGCNLYKKVRDSNFIVDDEDWYIENGFREEYILWDDLINKTLKIYVDIIIFYDSELVKIYDEVVDEWNKNILMKEEEGYYWNEVKRKWIEKE